MQWSYVHGECVPLYRQLAMATTVRLFDSREALWHLPGCADTVGLSSGVSFCSRWTIVESQSKEFERNRNINFQSSKTRGLFTIDCNSKKESKRELNICTILVYQGLEKSLWQVCIRECDFGINITDWCCRIIVEAHNSRLITQLATPINGRKPAYHQANTSTTTKNHCEQSKKKSTQKKT